MAKVILISAKLVTTIRPLGSVVDVLPDSEPMNAGMSDFDMKKISGTVAEVKAELAKLLPKEVSTDEKLLPKYDFAIEDDTKTTVADAFKTKVVAKTIKAVK